MNEEFSVRDLSSLDRRQLKDLSWPYFYGSFINAEAAYRSAAFAAAVARAKQDGWMILPRPVVMGKQVSKPLLVMEAEALLEEFQGVAGDSG